jgi:hypothetical protein
MISDKIIRILKQKLEVKWAVLCFKIQYTCVGSFSYLQLHLPYADHNPTQCVQGSPSLICQNYADAVLNKFSFSSPLFIHAPDKIQLCY